jgi:hypothetical protein
MPRAALPPGAASPPGCLAGARPAGGHPRAHPPSPTRHRAVSRPRGGSITRVAPSLLPTGLNIMLSPRVEQRTRALPRLCKRAAGAWLLPLHAHSPAPGSRARAPRARAALLLLPPRLPADARARATDPVAPPTRRQHGAPRAWRARARAVRHLGAVRLAPPTSLPPPPSPPGAGARLTSPLPRPLPPAPAGTRRLRSPSARVRGRTLRARRAPRA